MPGTISIIRTCRKGIRCGGTCCTDCDVAIRMHYTGRPRPGPVLRGVFGGPFTYGMKLAKYQGHWARTQPETWQAASRQSRESIPLADKPAGERGRIEPRDGHDRKYCDSQDEKQPRAAFAEFQKCGND